MSVAEAVADAETVAAPDSELRGSKPDRFWGDRLGEDF